VSKLELELEFGAWEEVAITKNVVRSKRITSVALHASAKVVKCLESTAAFGMRVWTILDHACGEHQHRTRRRKITRDTYSIQTLVVDTGPKHNHSNTFTLLLQILLLFLQNSPLEPDKVHLMHQQENPCLRTILLKPFQTIPIIL
jgi:hypothetical protein